MKISASQYDTLSNCVYHRLPEGSEKQELIALLEEISNENRALEIKGEQVTVQRQLGGNKSEPELCEWLSQHWAIGTKRGWNGQLSRSKRDLVHIPSGYSLGLAMTRANLIAFHKQLVLLKDMDFTNHDSIKSSPGFDCFKTLVKGAQ
jgi:hypothetical protein